MTRIAQYLALCAVMIVLLALLTTAVTAGASQAIWASASLAFVVQVIAFTLARRVPPERLMVGWGMGAVLRMISVVLYGVVVAKVWGAPIAPALLSFVGFLFVTTVVEPVFLK